MRYAPFYLAVIAALFLSFTFSPSAAPPPTTSQAYGMTAPQALPAMVSLGVTVDQTRADQASPEIYYDVLISPVTGTAALAPTSLLVTYDRSWASTSTEFSRPPADPSFSGGSADLTPLLTSTTEALIGPDPAIPLRV